MSSITIPPSPTQKSITFAAAEDQIALEGLLVQGSQPWGAILCHPHPLHGGTMHNKVIDAAMRAVSSMGGSALRFNFRGVGHSEGAYGEGIDEVRDLVGAIDWMQTQNLLQQGLLLVGFSFGTGVIGRYMTSLHPTNSPEHRRNRDPLTRPEVDGVVLIAPPLQHAQVPSFPVPARWGLHLILGEHDSFCTATQLQNYRQTFFSAQVRTHIVPHTDHFFHGSLHEVVRFIQTISHLPHSPLPE